MDSLANLDLSAQNIWAAIGIVCFIVEMVAPAFVMLFAGIGALAVAALLVFFPELGLVVQLLVFSGATGASLLLLRPTLLKRYQATQDKGSYSEYEGELATVVQELRSNGMLRVRFRGTEWDARASSEAPVLVAGQTVRVIRMDGTVAVVDVL